MYMDILLHFGVKSDVICIYIGIMLEITSFGREFHMFSGLSKVFLCKEGKLEGKLG